MNFETAWVATTRHPFQFPLQSIFTTHTPEFRKRPPTFFFIHEQTQSISSDPFQTNVFWGRDKADCNWAALQKFVPVPFFLILNDLVFFVEHHRIEEKRTHKKARRRRLSFLNIFWAPPQKKTCSKVSLRQLLIGSAYSRTSWDGTQNHKQRILISCISNAEKTKHCNSCNHVQHAPWSCFVLLSYMWDEKGNKITGVALSLAKITISDLAVNFRPIAIL